MSSFIDSVKSTILQNPSSFLEQNDCDMKLEKMLKILNDEDESLKLKLDVLLIFAECATVKRYRNLMLEFMNGITNVFDENLNDKLEGKRSFGTKIGRLHELVLIILVRLLDYKLEASSFLQLLNGDLSISLHLLIAVFKVPSYEDAVILQLVHLLSDFVNPSFHVTGKKTKLEYANFSAHVTKIQQQCLRQSLVKNISISLYNRFLKDMSSPVTVTGHQVLTVFFRFVLGVFTFSSKAQEWRQHLLVTSEIMDLLLVPTCKSCAKFSPALLELGWVEDPIVRPTLSSSLRLLVLCNFEMEQYRMKTIQLNPTNAMLRGQTSQLETYQASSAGTFFFKTFFYNVSIKDAYYLCDVTNYVLQKIAIEFFTHPSNESVLVLLLLFNINANTLTSEENNEDEILPDDCSSQHLWEILRTVIAVLDGDACESILAVLESIRSLPVTRDNFTYKVLVDALSKTMNETEKEEMEGKEDRLIAERARESARVITLVEKEEMEGKEDRPIAERTGEPARVITVVETKKNTLHHGRALKPKGVVESRFRLLGNLPRISVKERFSQTKNMQDDNQRRKARKEKAVRRKRKRDRRRKRREAKMNGGELEVEQLVIEKKNNNEEISCPEEFLCGINRHIMESPVRTPHGQTFERESIVRWLGGKDGTCPVTQKSLTMSDLQEDKKLKEQILQWNVNRVVRIKRGATDDIAGDNSDDMYEF
eukprot:g6529.t1